LALQWGCERLLANVGSGSQADLFTKAPKGSVPVNFAPSNNLKRNISTLDALTHYFGELVKAGHLGRKDQLSEVHEGDWQSLN
jgi:hypothetical protein